MHISRANVETEIALLGYARVSADGQSLTAQVAGLKATGCTEIFHEKSGGAKPDRKQLTRLVDRLGRGDVLIVTRLDRLARSTRDLLNVLGARAQPASPRSEKHRRKGPISNAV